MNCPAPLLPSQLIAIDQLVATMIDLDRFAFDGHALVAIVIDALVGDLLQARGALHELGVGHLQLGGCKGHGERLSGLQHDYCVDGMMIPRLLQVTVESGEKQRKLEIETGQDGFAREGAVFADDFTLDLAFCVKPADFDALVIGDDNPDQLGAML